jgi:hypothetical protein
MMCSTTKSTITVQCPNCRHEGPAFRELLGQRSRCKMCNHVFQINGLVRMVCPGCGATLRVLPEMLDREVVCKFCNEPFRACSELTRIVHRPCPGEHAAIKPACDHPAKSDNDPNIRQELEAARAELIRMGQERLDQVERVLALEQAFFKVLSEQETLQAGFQRLRSENQTLAEHERLEIESLRTELKRIEVQRLAIVQEHDLMRASPPQARTGSQPPLTQNHTRHNGNVRVLSSRPPQKTAPAGTSKPRPQDDRAILRDASDRISHCELKAGQLVAQLKTVQQDKELERQAFEKVLVRLQEALTRAKSEFDAASGSTRAAADRLIDQNDDPRQLAASPPTAD